MADDEGAAEKRLDAIIVEVNAFRRRRTFGSTTLADQLRRSAVEDALDQEAARPRDRHHDLGKVCRPPLRQRLQMGAFRLNGSHPLLVAPGNQRVDEAPVIFNRCEVAAAAQDQCLFDGFLKMSVLGFHRPVLVGLTTVVAAGVHAVMANESIIAIGNILALIGGQVTEG
jgi:hypothetical protein